MDKKTENKRKTTRSSKENEQTFTVPAHFFPDLKDPGMYQVNGNGMKNAAILDKDWIILDRKRQAKSGDIVIVTTDGITALRRIFFEDDHIRIRREDGVTEDVITTDCRIEGVMAGLIRGCQRN